MEMLLNSDLMYDANKNDAERRHFYLLMNFKNSFAATDCLHGDDQKRVC